MRILNNNKQLEYKMRNLLIHIDGDDKFLMKIHAGDRDTFCTSGRNNPYVGYVIWQLFKPEDLGIDGEMIMVPDNSGVTAYKEFDTEDTIIRNCIGMVRDDDAKYTVLFSEEKETINCEEEIDDSELFEDENT